MKKKIEIIGEVSRRELERNNFYMVYVPDFCESNWDIGEYDGECLTSQSNGSDLLDYAQKIFHLNTTL